MTDGGVARQIPVSSSTNRLNGTGMEYDVHGNLESEPLGDPVGSWIRHLRFDPGNRLVAAWATGATAPTESFGFAYDFSGERVLKFEREGDAVISADVSLRDEGGNLLTQLQWSPLNPTAAATPGSWSRLQDHIYLGREPAVRLEWVDGSPYYTSVVADHLGSTRAEVTGAGAFQALTYWPFGELTETPNYAALKGPHLFTAHEREWRGIEDGVLMGLDYMHARYYSSGLGRFLSVDPVGGEAGASQTWNRFGYVLNNPLKLVDPEGLAETVCPDGPTGQCYTGMVVDVNAADPAISRTPSTFLRFLAEGMRRRRAQDDFETDFLQKVRDGRIEVVQNVAWWPVSLPGEIPVFRRFRPINLPGWKNISIDMEHVINFHTVGGKNLSATKTIFPAEMSAAQIESAIRQAYRYGTRVGGSKGFVQLEGYSQATGLKIGMWLNRATKEIESAWPIFGG